MSSGAWMAASIGIGTALGVALDNLAGGVAVGVVVGIAGPALARRRDEE